MSRTRPRREHIQQPQSPLVWLRLLQKFQEASSLDYTPMGPPRILVSPLEAGAKLRSLYGSARIRRLASSDTQNLCMPGTTYARLPLHCREHSQNVKSPNDTAHPQLLRDTFGARMRSECSTSSNRTLYKSHTVKTISPILWGRHTYHVARLAATFHTQGTEPGLRYHGSAGSSPY